MKRIVRLTEGDLTKLINRIVKEEKIMEALDGGAFTNEVPNKVKFTNTNVIKLSGSELFPTGSFKINTNSQVFKDSLMQIKLLPEGTEVEVQGGASAVGSKSGFNNAELAMNRARAFVEALTNNGVKNLRFTILGPIVGKSEVYNSPEAKAEQFVKYSVVSEQPGLDIQIARDNTAVNREPYQYKKDELKKDGLDYIMLFEVTYSPSQGQYSANIFSTIQKALKGKVISLKNVTNKYK